MLPGMKANRQPEIAAQRPHHGSADAIRFDDDGIFRDVEPFAIESRPEVTVFRFPIDIANRGSVGVGAAQPLAGFETVKPGF